MICRHSDDRHYYRGSPRLLPQSNAEDKQQGIAGRQYRGKNRYWIAGPVVPINSLILIFICGCDAGIVLLMLHSFGLTAGDQITFAGLFVGKHRLEVSCGQLVDEFRAAGHAVLPRSEGYCQA
jgi:hypothetical protein